MGQPDGDLSQSPEKSCLIKSKKESEERKTIVQPDRTNISENKGNNIEHAYSLGSCEKGISAGTSCSSTGKCSRDTKLVSPVNDDKREDFGDVEKKISESDISKQQDHGFCRQARVIHSHQESLCSHPRLGSAKSGDTVKNISEESGLSSSGDVSSSLSSSESFSEDISPKSLEKEALTTERLSREETEAGCQEGADVIQKLERKSDEKCFNQKYELDCSGDVDRRNNKDEHDDNGGDQHVHCNDEVVKAWNLSSNCDTTSVNTADEGVEITARSTRGAQSPSGSCIGFSQGNSIMMMEKSEEIEERQFKEKAAGAVLGESCQTALSSHPTPAGGDGCATDGKNGNHAENIWTFPSLEMSSSSSCAPVVMEGKLEDETAEKQQSHQQNRDSRPASREKRRVFGLSGFGCRFNLNKIFSSVSSSSSSPSQRAATHLSTERLNNQLSTFPSGSQGVPSLTMGTTTLLSNVSKSSSESNILMCHNSLDNLTDELPSSRSTDSSCLLPTSAVDDQVLDHHHHHRHHQGEDELKEGYCCCCSCCCCKSNGTCDHLRRCIGHSSNSSNTSSSNASSRCSSSPATVGRQQKAGNLNSDGKVELDDDVDGESVLLTEETNNNNHQVELENRSNHFTDGNNSNSVETSSCNPTCSYSHSPSSTKRVTVLRTGAGGSDDGDMGEEMRNPTACGSSASLSNQNRNYDAADGSSCSGNNCTVGRCAAKSASDPVKQNGTSMTVGPTFENNLGKKSTTCSSSSSSSSSSSASPSCSTTGHNSCSSESKGSGDGGGDGSCESSGSSTSSSAPFLPNTSHGQKFKLLSDGDVQVCRVKHGKNLVDKVIGSKLLRRWETHHLYLNDACISSKTVSIIKRYFLFILFCSIITLYIIS